MISSQSAPLAGRTVLVTRAEHQAQSTVDAVEQRGGQGLLLPCLEVEYYSQVIERSLQAMLQDYTADLLLTSCNGVNSFLAQRAARDVLLLIGRQRRILAVGRHTADALRKIGITDAIIPGYYSQQGVATWWDYNGWPKRLIFIRAAQGREDLFPLLERHHCAVQLFNCYGSRIPFGPPPAGVVQQLEAGEVDAVLLGSSATARGLIARVGIDLARRPVAVAISKRVADECAQLGLCVQVVAAQASFDAMLDQLGHYFGGAV